MSFSTPTFNLAVNIWRSGAAYASPTVVTVGNLAYGRRVSFEGGGTESRMFLLLPKGTDIRSQFNGGASDIVEVPAGSKRFYSVTNVDDAGKGFSNEHRVAYLTQDLFTPFAGVPIPLPYP